MKPPANFPKDRISLCMIVRDEAERLPRCLAAAAPWVGEIVVVDTGSRDETVAIAESFGAKVVHFPWIDDFSAARNAALDAATRQWALVLDADEQLEVRSAEVFAHAVTQTKYAGFNIRCRNVHEDGRETNASIFRLFDRTLPDMRYRGALHEQVAAIADQRHTTASLDDVGVRHEGYMDEVIEKRDKNERNFRIAQKHLAAHPNDAHAWYVLGISVPPGRPDERRAALERALELANEGRAEHGVRTFEAHIYILLARIARFRDEVRFRQLLEDGIAAFPASPDLRLQRGERRLADGDFEGAIADFEACLSPAAARFLVVEGDFASIKKAAQVGVVNARVQRGRALLAAGDANAAAAMLEKIDSPSAKLEAGLAHLCAGRPKRAAPCWKRFLAESVERERKDALMAFRFLLGDGKKPEGRGEFGDEALAELDRWFGLLIGHRRFDEIEALINHGPQLGEPCWRPLRRRWAVKLAHEGFSDVALHLLLQARETEPEDADLYYWIGFCALNRQQVEDARVMWEACLKFQPEHALATEALSMLR